MLDGVDAVADVELHEEHVVSLGDARGLHTRQLAKLELEIVERVHPFPLVLSGLSGAVHERAFLASYNRLSAIAKSSSRSVASPGICAHP